MHPVGSYRTDSYCHLPLYNVPNRAHWVTALPQPPHYTFLACNGSALNFKLYWIKWNLLMKGTTDTSPLGTARRLYVPSVTNIYYTGHITLSGKELMKWWIGIVVRFKKNTDILNGGGTGWSGSLRHWATSWKVAGSIPIGVTGIFHWLNPSVRTMVR